MAEQTSHFDQQESIKPINRMDVSVALSKLGFSATPKRELLEKFPAIKQLLNAWLDQEQDRLVGGKISLLEFNESLAELYRDAGLGWILETLEAYEDFDLLAANTVTAEQKSEGFQKITDLCRGYVQRLMAVLRTRTGDRGQK